MVELRHLGLSQRRIGCFEVRAGVDHLLVQPQFVELVAEVVVVMHVVLRAVKRVSLQGREPRPQLLPLVAARRPFGVGPGYFVYELLEISMDLDQSAAVVFAEAHRRRAQQFEQHRPIADLHLRDRRLVRATELLAVPELHGDPRIAHERHASARY